MSRRRLIIFLILGLGFLVLLAGKKKGPSEQISHPDSQTRVKSESPSALAEPGRRTPVVPKGQRRLSVQVNLPEDGNFPKAFSTARRAGLQDVVLSLDWKDLETAKEQYQPDPNWLSIANAYYPTQDVALHLMIRPLHTNQLVIPEDLQNKPFDDPEVIRRFNLLLDWVFDQTRNTTLISLSIGSELDIRLRGDGAGWRQYEKFFRETAAYARSKKPGLKIAAETTYSVLTGPDLRYALSLNQYADVVGISYYATDADLMVQDPKRVKNDFKRVVNLFKGKEIIFYQIGYPSGVKCGSSEEKQAEFIRESFHAWDLYSEQILMLSYQWMFDLSPSALKGFVRFYQYDTPAFRDFLGTLGLKSWSGSGQDKPAWPVFEHESRARGW